VIEGVPGVETNEPLLLNLCRQCPPDIRKRFILFIATYKHETKLHLVFPYVEKNLEHVLRTEDYRAQDPSEIPQHWLWTQFRGVVQAMGFFHDQMSSGALKRPIYAVHFDLKPANILVTKNNEFKITDFGESFFLPDIAKPSNNEASNKINAYGSGDLVYKSPEIHREDPAYVQELRGATLEFDPTDENATTTTTTVAVKQVLLNYDVWQLACIMLLILTHLFDGGEAVKKLHRARRYSATNFYFFDPKRDPLAPKDFIKEKWEELEEKCCKRTQHIRARLFIRDVRGLAGHMFQVNPLKRVRSKNVVVRLNRMHDKFLRPWEKELDRLMDSELARDASSGASASSRTVESEEPQPSSNESDGDQQEPPSALDLKSSYEVGRPSVGNFFSSMGKM
jgi:serine/threonine protein kinase